MNDNTAQLAKGSLVHCIESEQPTLLKLGYACKTDLAMRREIKMIINTGASNMDQVLVDAINRIDARTDATDPNKWPMWNYFKPSTVVKTAFAAVTVIPSPLQDPEDYTEIPNYQLWDCQGTTIFVAKDTIELVRVADTYAGYDCYRHATGRKSEKITPQPGRVCLLTEKELGLLEFDGIVDLEIVLTYKPEECSGAVATRSDYNWPPSIRSITTDYPSIVIGIAPFLVPSRLHTPFFMGRARGHGYTQSLTGDINSPGAVEWCIQTNRMPTKYTGETVRWEGDGVSIANDIRILVNFFGMTIHTGERRKRRISLKSLGLIRSGIVAGAAIYELNTQNVAMLTAWINTRTFPKQTASMKKRNMARGQSKKDDTNTGGGHSNKSVSPCGLRVATKRLIQNSLRLRKMNVGMLIDNGCGVASTPAINICAENIYNLNAKAEIKDGEVWANQKRCIIRCPRWCAKDTEGLLKWLEDSPNVIMAGTEPSGIVFAMVKIANGSENQQKEAIHKWAHEVGGRFPRAEGYQSWLQFSVNADDYVTIDKISYTNWKAESLQTSDYDAWGETEDYSKPLKMKPAGVATPLERARAYVDKVELDEEGDRNRRLSSVMLNVMTKFGKEALEDVKPILFARSTLTKSEKNGMFNRMKRKVLTK